MVGDSSGHREDSPSRGIHGKVSRRRTAGGGNGDAGAGGGVDDPRNAVMKAAELGRLDPAQAKALLELTSRMGVLGFETSRTISNMVTGIALEDSTGKRTRLALKLKEYLEGDGLAKDLVPVISGAFALG